jgi:hypothetical protein
MGKPLFGMEGKDWATAIITTLMTAGATVVVAYIAFMQKAGEVNPKILEVAVSVLSQEPGKLQLVRGWAVDVISKAAPVEIPRGAREQLMQAPLPRAKEEKKGPFIRR